MDDLTATSPQTPTATSLSSWPVGDVMRRVQAQLRAGDAPSFEALLAFGAPAGPTR
ncbi:hypothetical protein [Egicoccus sp. AB-alg6-2]|uniref:hypothetical protein n=1 Tax=Egicoccus sp. AB-alg6-2 TaxID=3242692 RepID=UPI00359DF945